MKPPLNILSHFGRNIRNEAELMTKENKLSCAVLLGGVSYPISVITIYIDDENE
jgi:hypothetical protein